MTYLAYDTLWTVVLLIGLPFLPVLSVFGKRYRMGLGERLGFYRREIRNSVKDSRPLWIHAASVGEIVSACSLVENIRKRFPSLKIMVSAFTYTGYLTARRILSDSPVIFFPLDHPWIVKRALFTFDPSVMVFLETEIWPNLLRSAHRRGTPTLLLSGRLSERSFKKYSSLSWFFRGVLRNYSCMGMQTEEDVDRAKKLGVDPLKIALTGNLKRMRLAKCSEYNAKASDSFDMKRKVSGHLLVAGSSHRGEEEILLNAFRSLKQRFPDFRMVLAPRHPQRFAEVERLLESSGLEFEKKSEINGRATLSQDVLFLDTLGDLEELYAVGDVAFVGGSLVDAGGHNLLEPARFRRPILFGPYMANFAGLAQEMREKGGAVEVRDEADLVREITDLLNDANKRLDMGERAYQVAVDERRVSERTAELLYRYLQPL